MANFDTRDPLAAAAVAGLAHHAETITEREINKSWEGVRCRRCGTNLQNGKCPIQGRKKDDCPGNKPWKPGER